MKAQFVSVSVRRSLNIKSFKSSIKFIWRAVKCLSPLFGLFMPVSLITALSIFGMPALLISDGDYACNYVDLVGRFGTPPIHYDCPYIGFRPINLIPNLSIWSK